MKKAILVVLVLVLALTLFSVSAEENIKIKFFTGAELNQIMSWYPKWVPVAEEGQFTDIDAENLIRDYGLDNVFPWEGDMDFMTEEDFYYLDLPLEIRLLNGRLRLESHCGSFGGAGFQVLEDGTVVVSIHLVRDALTQGIIWHP